MFASKDLIKTLFITIFSLIIPFLATAETFRVHATKKLSVSSYGEKTSVLIGINEALIIEIPEDMTYVQGIELGFKIPQDIAFWRDCVAWSFYTDLTPEPQDDLIDYSGTRNTTGTFGTSLGLNMQIPLTPINSIKKTPYSIYIENTPDIINGKIFLRLQLVMKGTPDSLMDSLIEVTAKPILINKGKLLLDLIPPDNKDMQSYTLYVDGKTQEYTEDGIFLDTGVHDINLISDFYRNEVRTITIDQAKTKELSINLRDITPLVRINAPVSTKVYCDDQEVTDNDFTQYFKVQQGQHVFKFVIGDYEIIRTLTAINGESYTLTVSVEAEINQDE